MKSFYDWCICSGLVLVGAYIYMHGVSTGVPFHSRAVFSIFYYFSLVSFLFGRGMFR